MNATHFLPSVLCAALAGYAGYCAHGFLPDRSLNSPVESVPPLDCFRSVQSFSEVAVAKDVLQSLCSRYLYEVQVERSAILHASNPNVYGPPAQAPDDPTRVVQMLERGIEEFKGTRQELAFTQELLMTLSSLKRYDQWLDVYLDTLYRQPTEPIVARFAAAATTVSRQTGRVDDLLAAFRHLRGIPLEFPAKTALAQMTLDAAPPQWATNADSP